MSTPEADVVPDISRTLAAVLIVMLLGGVLGRLITVHYDVTLAVKTEQLSACEHDLAAARETVQWCKVTCEPICRGQRAP